MAPAGEAAFSGFMLVICGEIDYNIHYHKIETHPERKAKL